MPLPEDLTYVTVVGKIADVAEGEVRAVVFRTRYWLQGNPFVRPFGMAATVAADGTFAIDLPATDDPAWSPSGRFYDVTVQAGSSLHYGTLLVPMATVGSLELSTHLISSQPPAPQNAYVLLSARGVAGGVAALDADGDVTDAAGTKITGGEGGATSWSSITGKPSTFPPALPIAASGVTGLAAFEIATDATLSDHEGRIVTLEDAAGGGGSTITTASARVTTGDLATGNDASFAVVAGFSASIAAVSGDRVRFTVSGLLDMAVSLTEFFEMCTLISGAAVTYSSSGNGTPSTEGDPALYPSTRFRGTEVSFYLTVAPGDLSGGNVTFGFAHKGAGSAKIFASSTYPLRWNLVNLGQ